MLVRRGTAVVCVECQAGVLGENSVLPALAADARAVLPAADQVVRHSFRMLAQVLTVDEITAAWQASDAAGEPVGHDA